MKKDKNHSLSRLNLVHVIMPAVGLVILFGLVFVILYCRDDNLQRELIDVSSSVTEEDMLFNSALEKYANKLTEFRFNLRFQFLFLIVTLLLMIRKSDNLVLLNNSIPLSWLHFLSPMVMIYLWMNFGFLLDDLIDLRLVCISIIESNPETQKIAKILLNDSNLIDAWFVLFIDNGFKESISGINAPSINSAKIGLSALSLLLSSTHACILSSLLIGIRRYISSNYWQFWYYLIPLLLSIFIVFTHIDFMYVGKNENWLHLMIGVFTPIFVFVLTILAAKSDFKRFS